MVFSSKIKFSKLESLNLLFFKKYIRIYYTKLFYSYQFTIFLNFKKFYKNNFSITCVFLPPKKIKINVLRSPHVYKKSKEKFIILSHYILLNFNFNFNFNIIFLDLVVVSLVKMFTFWFFNSNLLEFKLVKQSLVNL